MENRISYNMFNRDFATLYSSKSGQTIADLQTFLMVACDNFEVTVIKKFAELIEFKNNSFDLSPYEIEQLNSTIKAYEILYNNFYASLNEVKGIEIIKVPDIVAIDIKDLERKTEKQLENELKNILGYKKIFTRKVA